MVGDGVWHCAIPYYCLVNQTSRWGNKCENPGYYGYRVLALQLISLKIDLQLQIISLIRGKLSYNQSKDTQIY